MRQSSKRTKERVVSSGLREVAEQQGTSTRGGIVTLTTGGTRLSATLGTAGKKQSAPRFSNEVLDRLQLKTGMSDNNMKVLDNCLRVVCGRSSVSNHEQHMKERNTKLTDLFDHTHIVLTEYVTEEKDTEGEKKQKKKTTCDVQKPVVYVKDVEQFASLVMAHRNLQPADSLVQIGIDDGQGQVKIMMSIKHKEEGPVCRKKSRYADGFAPKDFKLSGVKKLLLLLMSPTCERHDNISKLLELLGIEAIEFGFSCDVKMLLILLGKQGASCTHCCPFCDGRSPWVGTFNHVTIGSLWRDYHAYTDAMAAADPRKPPKAMDYNNVVNRPLVIGPADKKILGDLVYFPEHHIFTGILGKLIMEMERKLFDSAKEGVKWMDEWMATPGVNVSRTVYHGSASFVGNQARRLLTKLDSLEIKLEGALQGEKLVMAKVFIKALRQFEQVGVVLLKSLFSAFCLLNYETFWQVIVACFGQDLKPDYKSKIGNFMVTYRLA